MSSSFFFGWELGRRDNWKELTPAPRAPKNFKDPEKIRIAIEEKTAALEEEAIDGPLTGILSRVVVLNETGEQLLDTDAINFYSWATELKPPESGNLVFFGRNSARRIHQAALQALTKGMNVSSWGLYLRHPRPVPAERPEILLIDPVIVVAEKGDDESLQAALKLLNLPYPSNAKEEAETCRMLAIRLRLCPQ